MSGGSRCVGAAGVWGQQGGPPATAGWPTRNTTPGTPPNPPARPSGCPGQTCRTGCSAAASTWPCAGAARCARGGRWCGPAWAPGWPAGARSAGPWGAAARPPWRRRWWWPCPAGRQPKGGAGVEALRGGGARVEDARMCSCCHAGEVLPCHASARAPAAIAVPTPAAGHRPRHCCALTSSRARTGPACLTCSSTSMSPPDCRAALAAAMAAAAAAAVRTDSTRSNSAPSIPSSAASWAACNSMALWLLWCPRLEQLSLAPGAALDCWSD